MICPYISLNLHILYVLLSYMGFKLLSTLHIFNSIQKRAIKRSVLSCKLIHSELRERKRVKSYNTIAVLWSFRTRFTKIIPSVKVSSNFFFRQPDHVWNREFSFHSAYLSNRFVFRIKNEQSANIFLNFFYNSLK